MSESREAILEFLRSMLDEEFGLNDPAPASDDPLFTVGLLDSVDILSVVAMIEERYPIRVNPMSVSMEKLDSIERMAEFIKKSL